MGEGAPLRHGHGEELGDLRVLEDLPQVRHPLGIAHVPAQRAGGVGRGATETTKNALGGESLVAFRFFVFRNHRLRHSDARKRTSERRTLGSVMARTSARTMRDARRNAYRAQTRRPERARRRDTTIRATDTSARDAGIDGVERPVFFSRARQSKHRASCATSWSPRAPGGQPGTRARLRKHATHAPRRARDAEARAPRREKPCSVRKARNAEKVRAWSRKSARALASVVRRSTSEKSAMEKCLYGERGLPLVLSMVRAHALRAWKVTCVHAFSSSPPRKRASGKTQVHSCALCDIRHTTKTSVESRQRAIAREKSVGEEARQSSA